MVKITVRPVEAVKSGGTEANGLLVRWTFEMQGEPDMTFMCEHDALPNIILPLLRLGELAASERAKAAAADPAAAAAGGSEVVAAFNVAAVAIGQPVEGRIPLQIRTTHGLPVNFLLGAEHARGMAEALSRAADRAADREEPRRPH